MQLMIMPTTNTGYHGAREPKYKASLGNFDNVYSSATDQLTFVGSDISGLPLLTLQLNLDILSYDANLDNPFSLLNALLLFQTAHENRFIPVDWMVLGMTFRTIARRVMALMQIGDYMRAHGYELRAIGFDDELNNYTVNELASFYAALANRGIDSSGLGTLMTLREALNAVIGQVDSTPRVMNGVGTV